MHTAFFQNLLALLLVFVFPLIDLPMMLRLRRNTSKAARIRAYRSLLCLLWGSSLIVGLALGRQGLATVFTPAWTAWVSPGDWRFWLAAALVTAYLGLGFVSAAGVLVKPSRRIAYRKALRPVEFLLPVSPTERMTWAAVAISAGICEEFLYRGFLMHVLYGAQTGGFRLGLLSAWLVTSLAFSAAHLYQGVSGALSATLAGMAFGMVAILSGGLWLPMLLHAVTDLQVLWMYRPAIDAPQEAQRLIDGASPPARRIAPEWK